MKGSASASPRHEQGVRGRAILVYDVSDEAGWGLGVDIGSTQISFMGCGLNGKVLCQASIQRDKSVAPPGELVGEWAAHAAAFNALGVSRAVVVALNQVVSFQLAYPH